MSQFQNGMLQGKKIESRACDAIRHSCENCRNGNNIGRKAEQTTSWYSDGCKGSPKDQYDMIMMLYILFYTKR